MGTSEESLCVISQQSRLRNWIGRSFETAYLGKSNERPPPLARSVSRDRLMSQPYEI